MRKPTIRFNLISDAETRRRIKKSPAINRKDKSAALNKRRIGARVWKFTKAQNLKREFPKIGNALEAFGVDLNVVEKERLREISELPPEKKITAILTLRNALLPQKITIRHLRDVWGFFPHFKELDGKEFNIALNRVLDNETARRHFKQAITGPISDRRTAAKALKQWVYDNRKSFPEEVRDKIRDVII